MSFRVHKIASVVHRLGLDLDVTLTDSIEPSSGSAVVVRALREKRVYSELELGTGRLSKIFRGDVFVGALGRRRALRGFCGEVPEKIAVGDTLSLLNQGGVLGSGAAPHMDIGTPLACEVLGAPLKDDRPAHLRDARIPAVDSLVGVALPPVVAVSGSSMSCGKTFFLSELTQELFGEGLSVAGGKLTGIARLQDTIALEDHGATATASFLDVGLPSTAGLPADELAGAARSVIAFLASGKPDLILLEFGDGILGEYGVLKILREPEIRSAVTLHVFCATDLAGAWAGKRFLGEQGIEVGVFSGPCTDTSAGIDYLERELQVRSVNAFQEPEWVAREVRERCGV